MRLILVWLAASIGLASPGLAWEGPQVEYSGDTRMETADGVMEGVVYHAPGKERRETKMGDESMTMIIRHDKQMIWTLMPDANAFATVFGLEGTVFLLSALLAARIGAPELDTRRSLTVMNPAE